MYRYTCKKYIIQQITFFEPIIFFFQHLFLIAYRKELRLIAADALTVIFILWQKLKFNNETISHYFEVTI